MARKVFYKYNPASDSYDRVYVSAKERVWIVVRHFLVGIIIASVLFVIAYYSVDFPREKELKAENEHLRTQLGTLNRQAEEALAVMQDIADRDNNFYRVMLQADPISNAQRFSGVERQRHYNEVDSIGDDELLLSVSQKLDLLDHQIYSQIKSFEFLREEAVRHHARLENIPAIQPVSESKLRQMASGYGYRVDPIYGTQKMHEGMDFAAPIGTPVYATGNGTVAFAGWKSGYGNVIEINHGYNYLTRYAHLNKIMVKTGQKVTRGEQIGEVGNTGKSTGPHLHYEVRLKGAPQNPVNYYFYDLTPQQFDEMVRQSENAGHVMD